MFTCLSTALIALPLLAQRADVIHNTKKLHPILYFSRITYTKIIILLMPQKIQFWQHLHKNRYFFFI